MDALESWGAEPRQVLEEGFGGDFAFYESCLRQFSQESFLQTLKDSLISEDHETAVRAVHTMKGSADSLGLFPIMDAAMTVLLDLRTGNLPQTHADLPELEAAFVRFKTLLPPDEK